MNRTKASLLTLAVLTVSPQAVPAPAGGTVSGKVTLSGTAPKGKPLDDLVPGFGRKGGRRNLRASLPMRFRIR